MAVITNGRDERERAVKAIERLLIEEIPGIFHFTLAISKIPEGEYQRLRENFIERDSYRLDIAQFVNNEPGRKRAQMIVDLSEELFESTDIRNFKIVERWYSDVQHRLCIERR